MGGKRYIKVRCETLHVLFFFYHVCVSDLADGGEKIRLNT